MEPKRASLILVVAAALPAAGIAVWSLQRTARDLVNPCITWETPPGAVLHISPDDPCRTRGAEYRSRAETSAMAMLIPGGVLAAALLAVAGAAQQRRRMLLAAGVWMYLETLVVFTIAPLTLIAATAFLVAANRTSVSST